MKHLLKAIVVALFVVAGTMVSTAQSIDSLKHSREELAVRQARYITQELKLDDAAAKKFEDTYCEFQKEVWALGPGKDLTTDERLDRSQKILNLRKKYNKIYRSFLTEQEVDKAYKLERLMMDRLEKRRGERQSKNKSGDKRKPKRSRR